MQHVASRQGSPEWTLSVVSIATFMLFLDVTIVNVVLPDIRAGLGASFRELQGVVVAYAIALGALLMASGSVADRVGRRRMFSLGLATFTIASGLCAAAWSPGALVIARAVQGAGGALMLATALPLLSAAFPQERRAHAIGIWGAITGTSIAAGPLLGGALGTYASWRWVFVVNVPFGIAALALTASRVTESRGDVHRRIDVVGAALATVALALTVWGVLGGSTLGWTSAPVVASLIAAAAAGSAFGVLQHRRVDPLVDPQLLRHRPFAATTLVATLFSAALFAGFPFIVIWFQDVAGLSSFETGLWFLPLAFASIIAAVVTGRNLDAGADPGRTTAVGLVLIAAALLVLSRLDASFDWRAALIAMVLAGAGAGLVNPPLLAGTVTHAPPDQSGMASGIVGTARQVGIALGVAVLGNVVQSATTFAAGYDRMLFTAAAIALASASVSARSLRLPR